MEFASGNCQFFIAAWWWLEPWNFEWLSIQLERIPTDKLHHFSECWNHQPDTKMNGNLHGIIVEKHGSYRKIMGKSWESWNLVGFHGPSIGHGTLPGGISWMSWDDLLVKFPKGIQPSSQPSWRGSYPVGGWIRVKSSRMLNRDLGTIWLWHSQFPRTGKIHHAIKFGVYHLFRLGPSTYHGYVK